MERLVRQVLTLLMVLALGLTFVHVIGELLGPPVRNLASEIESSVPEIFSSKLVTTALLALFLVGVAVRLTRAARQRSPSWRLREAAERRGRSLPRFPAEDIPVHNLPRPRPDPDPPLPF